MERLDHFLSGAQVASRKELKALLKAGSVTLNGAVCKDGSQKIDPARDEVRFLGQLVEADRRVILLLYKPAGYVTSTDDPRDPTVMELLPPAYRRYAPVPVGRLDKQTEGLLLLTNDGALAHRLISPKYEVEKEYFAIHEGQTCEEDVRAFQEGLVLADGTRCKPAVLTPLGPGQSRVIVTEGKYHQVRRMLASRGCPVKYLRRDREGSLTLAGMEPGQIRELTPQEVLELDR